MLLSRKAKVFALSLGKALSGLVTLASFSVLSHLLPEKQDYAAFRQTIMAFMIVTPLLTMGLGDGLYYLLPSEQKRKRGRISDSLIIIATTCCIFAAFLMLGGNQLVAKRFSNPQIAKLLLLIIPLCFAQSVLRLVAPVLTIVEQIMPLTIFNVASRCLIGILTIFPVLVWVNPTAPLIGMTIGTFVASICGVLLIFKYLAADQVLPNISAIGELLKFSLPLGVGGMISSLNLQLDKLVVSSMCAPEEFAVFSNGAIEIPLVGVLTGSIVAVLMVEMRKAVVDHQYQHAVELFRLTAKKTSYVLFPVTIWLLVFADPFIIVLFSDEYSNAASPFRLYLVLIPIRTVSFGALLVALGMSNVILFRGLVSILINVGLSIALVYLAGPIGAVASTILTVLFWTVPCNLFFLSKRLQQRWTSLLPWNHFGLTLLSLFPFAAVLFVVYLLTSQLNPILRLVVATVIATIWLAVWWNGKIFTSKLIPKLG